MKVFLKGGSNLLVNVKTGEAVYESVTRRPLIGAMSRLHYNPGQWWTYFADIFAILYSFRMMEKFGLIVSR